MRTRFLTALALLAAPAIAEGGSQPISASVRVYRHVTLIDAISASAQPDMAVTLEGDRIRAVSSDRTYVPIPQAEEIDARGLYVLPGLIETHGHLGTQPLRRYAEAVMRRQLYGGITAARDLAGDTRFLAEIQREALLGEIPGPDIHFVALMAGPSFFSDPRTKASAQGAMPGQTAWMQAIDDRTDIPLAVARARGTGATAIKLYANLSPRIVQRITDEAHRQGIKVWAHATVFPALPVDVVHAGVDVVSHVCSLVYQINGVRAGTYHQRRAIDPAAFAEGDSPQLAKLFSAMRRQGQVLDATLRVYARQAPIPAGPRRCDLALGARLANQAWRAGVPISAGTDGETEWSDPYPSLHEEIELLTDKAGLPPIDAIKAATVVAARAAGQEQEMGTIEPGKLANLVFVERNPLDDVSNLRSVVFTIKRGKLFRREDYRLLAKGDLDEPGLNQ